MTGKRTAASELRTACRNGHYRGLTTGLAAGFVQVNLVILPQCYAGELVTFCRANAAPCPVVAVGMAGEPSLPVLGNDIDVRSDCPRYWIFHDGRRSMEVDDIRAYWQDDFVTVAIGCWLSMEDALRRAGVRLRHVELGIQGPLMISNRQAVPVGRFSSPLVVSMRPFHRSQALLAAEVTGRFPRLHGAPIHMGDPHALGLSSFGTPDFGEPMDILPDEVPLFWGCGLTALVALQRSGTPLFITHAPGAMLVTDRKNDEFEKSNERDPASAETHL
jgi:uncharacterized protein YcsI (UPF0317 family)